MTLSSSMRSNSKRGLVMEKHKRGCSFDSGLTINIKDDDLLLFSDMQMRESENFLLNSSDDVDDSLAKLKHVSNSELRIRFLGEGSDLLNAGSEKNDYDWLLTPPETPLFPSLDDKELQSTRSVSRGRSRSQANATSTSSAMGKTQRTSRSSPSPIRSTPSSQLDSKQSRGRGRPSSARSASPASAFRSTTPSRSATPQNRSSTPTPRSSTPTHRRTSSGSSSSVASFGKATRGNSASPKLRGHWGNFPDLSSEAPSNLRTSISSWSASRTRESSPSSRNGIKVSLKGRRESLSPSASRSVSSSQSNDRDHFSSSCDDDVEFTYPVTLGVSTCLTLKNNENFVSGKNTTISKKPSRTVSSDSAPRGSFSLDRRQLHQGKAPHNKFRPLLSSVPPSSFHVTKPNANHRSLFSWNSSLTTSSNASSDQGASSSLDTEQSKHDQTHLAAESDTQIPFPEVQDDTLKADEADSKNAPKEEGLDKRSEENIEVNKIEQQIPDIRGNSGGEPSSDVECLKSIVCSKCDAIFQAFEFSNDKLSVCPECIERDENSSNWTHSPGFQETVMHISQNQGHQQCVNTSISGSRERFHLESDNFTGEPLVIEPDSQYFPSAPLDFNGDKKLEDNRRDDLEHHNKGENFPQFHASGSHQSSIHISTGGDVVPFVLENSSSSEGLVIQRRPNRAAAASSAETPLMENCMNILKRSEYPSVNPLLSVHSEPTSCVEPSLIECADISKSSDSSFVATVLSMHNESTEMDSLEVHVKEERSSASLATDHCFPRQLETDSHIQLPSQVHGRECITLEQGGNNLPVNLATHRSVNALREPHGEPLMVIEERLDQVLEKTNTWSDEPINSTGDEQSNERSNIAIVPNLEDLSATATSTSEDHILRNTWTSQKGMSSQCHVFHPVKKSGAIKNTSSGLEDVSSRSVFNIVGSSSSASLTSEKVKLVSRLESNYIDDDNDISGKSTITIHDPGKGNKSRSLTLEEATDGILFCSSIVHDLAFKAVSMAIEKDNPPSSSLSSTAQAVNPPPTMMHDKSTLEERNQTLLTRQGQKQVKKRISQELSSDLRPKSSTVESKCYCSVM